MKKSVLSLAALVLVSASSLTASAQSTVGANAVSGSAPRPQAIGGTIPRPQAIGGTIPRPQGILGGIYTTVMAFFGF